jgi:recombinational DNA repair ATPase RecF
METTTIFLKVNRQKLKDNIWSIQLQKVSDYIVKRKKINVKTLSLHFAEINDDFIKNKITLKITYNHVTKTITRNSSRAF